MIAPVVTWRPAAQPPQGVENADLVWVFEVFEGVVNIGYFDGLTWRLWGGSDDCEVTHWASMAYPQRPGQGGAP